MRPVLMLRPIVGAEAFLARGAQQSERQADMGGGAGTLVGACLTDKTAALITCMGLRQALQGPASP